MYKGYLLLNKLSGLELEHFQDFRWSHYNRNRRKASKAAKHETDRIRLKDMIYYILGPWIFVSEMQNWRLQIFPFVAKMLNLPKTHVKVVNNKHFKFIAIIFVLYTILRQNRTGIYKLKLKLNATVCFQLQLQRSFFIIIRFVLQNRKL